MSKEDNTYKKVWLHDENKDFVVIPYTTVDNIKIKNQNNFINFTDNYQQLEHRVENNENSIITLENKMNNYSNILYGDEEPNEIKEKIRIYIFNIKIIKFLKFGKN